MIQSFTEQILELGEPRSHRRGELSVDRREHTGTHRVQYPPERAILRGELLATRRVSRDAR